MYYSLEVTCTTLEFILLLYAYTVKEYTFLFIKLISFIVLSTFL